MTATTALPVLTVPPASSRPRRAAMLVERNARIFRARKWVVLSGMAEPLFYLASVGVGFGHLVGSVTVGGTTVPYLDFVAPALLATTAMNGAVFESTFNIFFKLKYAKTYDAVVATPLQPQDIAVAEVAWSLMRGALYAVVFLLAMAVLGIISSWWALLALPAALVVGLCFGGLGIAATSFMRSWADFDYVQLATLPLFLFSATFYPLSAYTPAVQQLVRITPLYNGVALLRSLVDGSVSTATLGHAVYLTVVGLVGLAIGARRLGRRLLH